MHLLSKLANLKFLFTISCFFIFIIPIPSQANDGSVTVTNLISSANNRIKQNSTPQAIFQIDISANSARKLSDILMRVSGTGFTSSVLKSITTDSSSGVLLYQESETSPNGLDSSDTLINIDASSGWFSSTDLYIFLQNQININSSKTFYLAIQTSSQGSDDIEIILTIPTAGVILSDDDQEPNHNTNSNTITIDTVGPTISKTEIINPISVDVTFSESVNETLAKNSNNYKFNNGLKIAAISKINDTTYRVISNTPLIASTTLTTSLNITDIAGNTGQATASNINIPTTVYISEIATSINNNGWGEFIELYNASASSVDISNWVIQYATYNSQNWSTKITIPTGTTIAPHSYYLVTSRKFYDTGVCPSTPLDFCQSIIGLPDSGGHLRLYTGKKEIDKIGWGNALYPESTAAPTLKNNQSLERKAFGTSLLETMISDGKDSSHGNSWDSDNNNQDFIKRFTIDPQSSASSPEIPDTSNYEGEAANGPTIKFTPIAIAATGAPLEIYLQAGDPQTPTTKMSVENHYTIGSDNTYISHDEAKHYHIIAEAISNGYFKFTIPQSHIDDPDAASEGIIYHLQIQTNTGSSQLSSDPQATTHTEAKLTPFIIKPEDSSTWTTYNISGTITDSSSTPIKNVLVFAEGTGFSTTTDETGVYTLTVKDNFPYNLTMIKQGYYEENISNIYVNGSNITEKNKTIYTGTGGGQTGDNSKPRIIQTFPQNAEQGILPNNENFKIFVHFTEDMLESNISTSTIILSSDTTNPIDNPLPGYLVNYGHQISDNITNGYPALNHIAIISAPPGGLNPNTTYNLVLTSNIRDTSGNGLAGNNPNGGHVISFTTGADFSSISDWSNFGSGEMTPPQIEGVTPRNGAQNIAPNTKINISFSEPMNPTSVTTSGNIKLIKISINGTTTTESIISSSVTLDNTSKNTTITPSSNLTPGRYKIVVTGALKSASGMWLGNPKIGANTSSKAINTSFFKINSNSGNDSTPPSILGTWPSSGDTNISVNPGSLIVQFSEAINPSTIQSNTISLSRGTSNIEGEINYDSQANSLYFIPTKALTPNTIHSFNIEGTSSGLTDMVGNALASSTSIIFTTSSDNDSTAPSIMFSNGDDYGIAITFSESMNAAKITDSQNWSTSVLNPANYNIKWGDTATVNTSGTTIDFANTNTTFSYNSLTNTVLIDNLGLTPSTTTNKAFYIDMLASNVSGSGVVDLSNNALSDSTNFHTPILSSLETGGNIGPTTGSGGGNNLEMNDMGVMKAGIAPMNTLAGQTTAYFVDIPVTKQIGDNYKILLTFPKGFNIANSTKDTYSPVNEDINEMNSGTITFSTEAETSGGSSNDGVSVNTSTNTITIDLSVTGTPPSVDYLHLDIDGIINTNIPRGPETNGYTVDMKILNSSGQLSETVPGMPFYIKASGNASLSGNILGISNSDTNSGTDSMAIYLNSPTTGPLESTVVIASNGTGSYSFSNIQPGDYYIYTDSSITFNTNKPDYTGITNPQLITLTSSANTKDIALTRVDTGSVATITVNLTGIPSGEKIDIIAVSPKKSITKKTTGDGGVISENLYLESGNWNIEIAPARSKAVKKKSKDNSNWTPPRPTKITSDGSTSQTISITLGGASKQITGYVLDDTNAGLSDVEVYAYSPMGDSQSSNTTTDTDGKFTLNVGGNGNYTLGAFKPGLPEVPEKNIRIINNNSSTSDSNTSADVLINGTIITDSNKLTFKIKKPNYTISGIVTDGTNNVSYTPVWAEQQDGLGFVETMTDSSGNYVLYVDTGVWSIQSYIHGYGESGSEDITISDSNQTLNLSPDSSLTYYSISGTITINSELQADMPIRAVAISSSTGELTGEEYFSSTDTIGSYTINAPAGTYRVDVWTPDFGEIERTDADDFPSSRANLNLTGNKTGVDVTIGSADLNTLTLAFTNGLSSQEAFINIISTTKDFRKNIKLNALDNNSSVMLEDDTYLFKMHIPGVGLVEPSTNPTTISTDSTITFVLPDSSTNLFTVSGTITSASSPLENAWVWVGNETTGEYRGDTTDSSGNYSITIKTGSYKIGVEMAGYEPIPPTDLTVNTSTTSDHNLTSSAYTIAGTIYADANSNSSYDSGEEVSDGWVWIEESTTKRLVGASTDSDGTFSIPVTDGTYTLKGVADGYSESSYGSITIASSSSSNNNIQLTAKSNWDNKLKSKPITPSSGGTLDDSGSSGSGVKITVPPNAFGSDTSNGSIKSKETSNVSKTSSANPLGSTGKEINATDSSGSAITNLSDDIEVELVYYMEDISSSISDYSKLSILTNSYWDTSVSNWVSMSTTKTAYTKTNSSDTDWTTVTDFDAFVTALQANSSTYGDYKISLNSNSDHLTIFGATTPTDTTPPSNPTNLSQTSGSGTSISIDWNDNSESDLLEYEIYRATSSSVTAISNNQINTSQVTASTYTDATTEAFTIYYYTVTAADDSGNESSTATELQVCSTSSVSNGSINNSCVITCDSGYTLNDTICEDTTAPSAPTSLSQTSGSSTSLILDWTDNSEDDIAKYNIYRDTSSGFTAATSTNQVNNSDVTSSTYTDSTTAALTVYYYQITALDTSNNESSTSTELQVCSTTSISNGSINTSCAITCNTNYTLDGTNCNANATATASIGGGGGGGGYSPPAVTPTYQTTATTTAINTAYQSAFEAMVAKANASANISTTNDTTTTSNTKNTTTEDTSVSEMITEASIVSKETSSANYANIFNSKRNEYNEDLTTTKYISILSSNTNALTNLVKIAMNNFITYGTFSTIKLGAGERAGVVNSFKSAFSKLPQNSNDWEDVIKIGNGRWPTQRSEASELTATNQFKKIYKRTPDRSNQHDDAAVTVMSYGLRPAGRNMNSEKAAIKSFKHIYNYHPSSALDWDIVRAIAYSGAKR